LSQQLALVEQQRQQLEVSLAASREREVDRSITQDAVKQLSQSHAAISEERTQLLQQLSEMDESLGEMQHAAAEAERERARLEQQVDSMKTGELAEVYARVAAVPSPIRSSHSQLVDAHEASQGAGSAPMLSVAIGHDRRAERVRHWLGAQQLDTYFQAFLEHGYDCLSILREAEPDEVGSLIDCCGMPCEHAQTLRQGIALLQGPRAPEEQPLEVALA